MLSVLFDLPYSSSETVSFTALISALTSAASSELSLSTGNSESVADVTSVTSFGRRHGIAVFVKHDFFFGFFVRDDRQST